MRSELKARTELALRRKALLDAGAEVLKQDRAWLESTQDGEPVLEVGERVGSTGVGYATMAKPPVVVEIVDVEQLDAFLTIEGKTVTSECITDEDEALKVLREHAPHLLVDVTRVPLYERDAAKSRAKAGESIPGIAVREGKSSLRLVPAKELKEWAQKAIGEDLAQLGGGE